MMHMKEHWVCSHPQQLGTHSVMVCSWRYAAHSEADFSPAWDMVSPMPASALERRFGEEKTGEAWRLN